MPFWCRGLQVLPISRQLAVFLTVLLTISRKCGVLEGRGWQLVRGILSRRVWLVLGLVAVLACAGARAENLDQGKSGQKLFADTCVSCHKSAKGLTKRGYLALYFFLKDHYVTDSTSAWALTSYLESVEDTPRGRSKKTAERAASPPSSPQVNWTSGAPPRPPAGVPKR
jgi:hypothetical protein